ncbi:hypothetical protein H6P81_005419 [Aristolochia fimbriata]|uniref:Uncharacterized protein n=1 Tax=Aristolochia fimbriata TaxID=158543 RepID=A0AAV7EWK6_ARIFI|nr:hypothetical protein H6P81_005419 [Aristolochia fimbriata]
MASSVAAGDEHQELVSFPTIYTCLEAYYVPSMENRISVSLAMEEFTIQKAVTPYGAIEGSSRRLLGQVKLAFDWDPTEKRINTLLSDLQRYIPVGIAEAFSAMEISPSASSKGLEEQIGAYVFFTVRAHFKRTCGIHGFDFGVRCEQKRIMTIDIGRDELTRAGLSQGLSPSEVGPWEREVTVVMRI